MMIQHGVSSSRPYTRLNFISGTKGAIGGLKVGTNDRVQVVRLMGLGVARGCAGGRAGEPTECHQYACRMRF